MVQIYTDLSDRHDRNQTVYQTFKVFPPGTSNLRKSLDLFFCGLPSSCPPPSEQQEESPSQRAHSTRLPGSDPFLLFQQSPEDICRWPGAHHHSLCVPQQSAGSYLRGRLHPCWRAWRWEGHLPISSACLLKKGVHPRPSAAAAGIPLAGVHRSMESQLRPALKPAVTAMRVAAWTLPPPSDDAHAQEK